MTGPRELLGYEEWADRRLLACALQAEDRPERVDLLISHLLCAQRIWISRILGQPSPPEVWPAIPPALWLVWLDRNLEDLQAIRSHRRPDKVITYRNSKGEAFRNSVDDILQHLLLHGAYHRGQIAQLLRPLTDKLPYTDFIFYAREQEGEEE
jgi:uncharacterized damage-inducible protein DinB